MESGTLICHSDIVLIFHIVSQLSVVLLNSLYELASKELAAGPGESWLLGENFT